MIATAIVLELYILHDIFYSFLSRSPRVSDFENIFALSDFSPLMSFGFFVVILLIIMPIVYGIYSLKKQSSTKKFYSLISFKIILLLALFYSLESKYFQNYLDKYFKYYNWSQAKTIKKNGRFTSMIYYAIQSKKAKKELYRYQNIDLNVEKLLFKDHTIKSKKNIYIVTLESFLDPRLIKDINFNRSPLAKEIKKYLKNQEFSHIISTAYGGGTAQAEFEILTGVRALAKINSIEFNTLQGNQIPSFTNLLK